MSFLSDAGGGIVQALTGTNPKELQSQLDAAEQNLQLAFETLITENAIVIFELAIVIILLWKVRVK